MNFKIKLSGLVVSLSLLICLMCINSQAQNDTAKIGGYYASEAVSEYGTGAQIIAGGIGASAGSAAGGAAGGWIGGAIGFFGGPATCYFGIVVGTIAGEWIGGA